LKLGLGLSGENHSAKTNVTTEPIAAPPALCFLSQNLNPITHNFPGTRTTFSKSKVEFKSGFLLIYGHEKKYFLQQKERAGGAAAGSAVKLLLVVYRLQQGQTLKSRGFCGSSKLCSPL
jgi:hypothetical protein